MTGAARAARVTGALTGAAAAAVLAVAACEPTPFGVGVQEAADAAGSIPRDAAALDRAASPADEAVSSRPGLPVPQNKPALQVTVAAGDTLYGLAHRHGVAAGAIIELNDLASPYWLWTGQRLRLPAEAFRTVRRGEEGPEAAPRKAAGKARAPPVSVEALDDGEPLRPDTRRADVALAPSAPAPERGSASVPLPPARTTFLWPIEGRVISRFGSKPDGMHNDGINIAAPVGSDIRAAQSGVVAYAGNELRGYGNLVLIRHDGGWMTAYAHNDTLLVGQGDVVRRGQVISRSGRSGRVSRPQAHFEIRRDGEPQDPLRLLTRK